MKLDEDTRAIFATKLGMTDEEIAKYGRGHLTLSHHDELIVNSTKLSRQFQTWYLCWIIAICLMPINRYLRSLIKSVRCIPEIDLYWKIV
mgnify:CR=1 FL=1